MEKQDNKNNQNKKVTEKRGLLAPREKYLEAGCHIGTKFKTGSMKDFIYKRRKDRLFVMNISKIDEQIRKAAELLAQYEPNEIIIVAVRTYAIAAGAKTSLILGTTLIPNRFIPGTFTNPQIKYFAEPKIVFVCDPKAEAKAICEANMMKIPVISLCDTENIVKGIDVVIPCNNKGKRSLALIFYLLTREYMMKKGMIKSYSEFTYKSRDFENTETIDEYFKTRKKDIETVSVLLQTAANEKPEDTAVLDKEQDQTQPQKGEANSVNKKDKKSIVKHEEKIKKIKIKKKIVEKKHTRKKAPDEKHNKKNPDKKE